MRFALALLLVTTATAHAAERVTLTNGFELRCDHHQTANGRARFYLTADESNYMEFRQAEIASIEHMDDPPPAPAAANDAKSATAAITPTPSPKNPEKLNPADLHQMLATAGGEHNLDVDLLASVVKTESGGNPRAVSRTGAKGLMQLMPGTASTLGVKDSFEPKQNVNGGVAYLDSLLVRYHDNLALALAAYNAGPESVDRHHGIPPYNETRAYVARVIHEFNRRVLAREAQARTAK